jgi:hypothetical protein
MTSCRIIVTDVSNEVTALILTVTAVQDEEYVEREGRGRKLLSNVSNNLPVTRHYVQKYLNIQYICVLNK